MEWMKKSAADELKQLELNSTFRHLIELQQHLAGKRKVYEMLKWVAPIEWIYTAEKWCSNMQQKRQFVIQIMYKLLYGRTTRHVIWWSVQVKKMIVRSSFVIDVNYAQFLKRLGGSPNENNITSDNKSSVMYYTTIYVFVCSFQGQNGNARIMGNWKYPEVI